jgi:hypothetical protein
MHGQPPHHNPLHAAAQEVRAVAREAKSPWFERMALVIMALSAAVTTAIGAIQVRQMLRREMKDEQRDQERERRTDPSSPPPDRPGHGATATAGMPPHGRDDDDRRWTRREEHAEAAAHGRQR